MEIGIGVGRELPNGARRQRVDEQIRQPALQGGKHYLGAVRRPARVVDLVKTFELNLDTRGLPRGVEYDENRVALAQRGHREAVARGVPGAGRGDVLKAVEMRIGRGAHQLANDPSARGIREE